jgi:hypothetical protein
MSKAEIDTESTKDSGYGSIDEALASMNNVMLRVDSSSSDDVPVKEVHILNIEMESPLEEAKEEAKEEANLIHEAGAAFQTMMANLASLAEELEIKKLGKDCSGAAFSMVESLTNPGRRFDESYHQVDTNF